MSITIDQDDAQLLAAIGFTGIGRGLCAQSRTVFEGLEALRPGSEAAAIGLALNAMGQGDHARAIALLRNATQSEAVIAFRVMAHARLGDTGMARELADELRAGGAPDDLLALADGALAAA